MPLRSAAFILDRRSRNCFKAKSLIKLEVCLQIIDERFYLILLS